MPLNKKIYDRLVLDALCEDAAHRDITSLDFISKGTIAEAKVIAKEEGVACGVDIACQVFKVFDKKLVVTKRANDGQRIFSGKTILTVKGGARSILSCERVALNFLSHLCGIATQTARVVRRVKPYGIQILDTRKTTPLLRSLEKYAIETGGGKNHRLDLSSQYLIKDNHRTVLEKTGGWEIFALRRGNIPFEIEVDDLLQFKKALIYCPDIIMLDNFSPIQVKQAIRLLKKLFPVKDKRPLVELSGGITIKNISRYAVRGVDFISLGALTHSVKALDLSLEITKVYRL